MAIYYIPQQKLPVCLGFHNIFLLVLSEKFLPAVLKISTSFIHQNARYVWEQGIIDVRLVYAHRVGYDVRR